MKTSRNAVRLLVSLVLLLGMLVSVAAGADEEPKVRSCFVKEVLTGGMYVYVRCQEEKTDVWLAAVDKTIKVDDILDFKNVPPMIDFYSKQLQRTFPSIIFTETWKAVVKRK